MALKYIHNEVMLQLSATWLDPSSEANKAISVVPDLASFLPRVQATHSTLSALLQPSPNAQIAAISAEEATLDLRHDDIIRGSFGFLTGMAELFGGEMGRSVLALRDHLIPEGPSSTQKSYRAEATQAAQLKDRISPEIKTKLDAIQVGFVGQTKPLSHFIDEWISSGKKLGDLEDNKARLQDAPEETTAMATLKARNLWIRTVNAFIANAELAGLDEATDRLVFGPLRIAEKNATRRERAGRGRTAEDNADTEGAANPGAAKPSTTDAGTPTTQNP